MWHKSGPKPYLSVAEENKFAILLAKAGYGKTKPVHNIAGMSAHNQGKVVHPTVSHGWFKRFLQRQPQLSYPRGYPTANVRMNCLSEDVIADYFALLKEELTKNILMNSPNRIYSVDETQICLDGHAPWVVALEGQKEVQYRTVGKVEEGYNLPDVDYIQWLHEIHPDADNTSGNDFVSLADCFPDMPITTAVAVLPESPVEMPAETENNETSPDKATPFEAGDSEMSADRGALPNNTSQSEEKSVEVGCDTAPLQKGINARPSNVLPNDTTVNSKAVEDEGELQYISKYLVPDIRSQKKEQTVRARVPTGDKCAEILKEHEQKKQKEEKEKRKLLREQKKKEKEEELKKKKAAAAEKTVATAVTKEITEDKGASDATENVETPAESEETRKWPTSSYTLRAKRTRYDVVDSDALSCSSGTTSGNASTSTTMWQCSICYEDYDAIGTEDWVQCGCGR